MPLLVMFGPSGHQQYWVHAFHLASAIYFLLSSSVNANDLAVDNKLLEQFATDLKTLFGMSLHRNWLKLIKPMTT